MYLELGQLKVNGKACADPFPQYVVEKDGEEFQAEVYVGSRTSRSRGVTRRIPGVEWAFLGLAIYQRDSKL